MLRFLNGISIEDASSQSGCPLEIIQDLVRSHEFFVTKDECGRRVISRSCLPLLRSLAERRKRAAPAGRGKVIA